MDRQAFQGWLDRYVEAWKSYDEQAIGDLFSENVEYRYHPQDDATKRPRRGRQGLDREQGRRRHVRREVRARGDRRRHVRRARLRASYFDEQGKLRDEYMNVYFIKFDGDGRATEFTEYWIQNRDFRRRDRNELIRQAAAGEVQPSEEPAPAIA